MYLFCGGDNCEGIGVGGGDFCMICVVCGGGVMFVCIGFFVFTRVVAFKSSSRGFFVMKFFIFFVFIFIFIVFDGVFIF